MLNQKLIFHAVIYDQQCRDLWKREGIPLLEPVNDCWARELGYHSLATSFLFDHIHLLLEQSGEESVQKCIRRLTGRIQRWLSVNESFTGQLGFALFSVSYCQLELLTRFVETQWEHHFQVGFEEELTSLLDRNAVDAWQLPSGTRLVS